MSKRLDYISWDEYFMGIALLASKRSKDPDTQTGAVIVDAMTNNIISIGYNGFPCGCHDDLFPWEDADDLAPLDSKHMYVVHSELNAILNAQGTILHGCTMYTTLFPCSECAKAIIQSGICHVVYLNAKLHKDYTTAAKRMFDTSGVTYQQYKLSDKIIMLTL